MECVGCNSQFYLRPSAVAKGRRYCSVHCYRENKARLRLEEFGVGNYKCPGCMTIKPLSEFTLLKRGAKTRVASWCKKCKCEYERRRRIDPQRRDEHKTKYEGDIIYRVRSLLKAMEKRARRRGVPFDLDEQWMAERFAAGVCELTGIPFDMTVDDSKPNIRTPSVDRIDSRGGYTKSNCRVLIMGLNFALRDWGLDAFLPIARALVARSDT